MCVYIYTYTHICIFYIYVKLNHWTVHLKLTQHCKSTILQLREYIKTRKRRKKGPALESEDLGSKYRTAREGWKLGETKGGEKMKP